MKKSYLFLLIIAALVVITFSFISYLMLKKLIFLNQSRKELFIQNQQLTSLLSNLKDAETGQRGFIITANNEYLKPYYQALEGINEQLDVLKQENAFDSNEYYQALNSSIQSKLSELAYTLEVRKQQNFEAAQQIISQGEGKQFMDHVRSLIHEMEASKKQKLKEKEEEIYRTVYEAVWIRIIGNFLSSGLMCLFVYLIYRYAKVRKTMERELQKSYTIQQTILNSARQYIITTNKEGIITTFNRGAERMLGYQADEVVNKISILDLYAPEMIENLVNDISRRTGSKAKMSFEVLVMPTRYSILIDSESLLKAKNGKVIPCLQSISPLRGPDKAIIGFLFIGTDVTERKLWEEDLKKAVEAADAANLAKTKFLANISHDLRTPLNSIIGFSTILLKNKRGNLNEQDISFIQRVSDNGKSLLKLINEILDLSKIEAGMAETKKSTIILSDLIHKILSQLEGKILDKNIKLITDIPEDLKPFETDLEKLEVILHNLIGNALKYTKQGQILVKVNMNPESHEATEIEIIDTGIGIPENLTEKIFEPFFQIDNLSRHYGGSGLGLSITHSIAQVLGYQIQVKSQVEKGSTFTIILHPDPAALLTTPSAFKEENILYKNYEGFLPLDLHNQTVLLIDNDVDFLSVLGKQFQDLGCRVFISTDGEKALNIAKKNHIDLITSGVIIQPMNGYEIIQRLQEDKELRKIPFAFVSLVANEIRGKIPGAIDYLSKHITHSDLINLLKKASFHRKKN
jgi:PAS domain S-box-containing protein